MIWGRSGSSLCSQKTNPNMTNAQIMRTAAGSFVFGRLRSNRPVNNCAKATSRAPADISVLRSIFLLFHALFVVGNLRRKVSTFPPSVTL
jgi:hypothetical protein